MGFIAGFFNDDTCLAAYWPILSASFFSSEQSGRDEMLADVFAGQLDLGSGTASRRPPGTHLVDAPVEGCGPLLSMITSPPSIQPRRRDVRRRADERQDG